LCNGQILGLIASNLKSVVGQKVLDIRELVPLGKFRRFVPFVELYARLEGLSNSVMLQKIYSIYLNKLKSPISQSLSPKT
jgi:hypothetical protein